MDLRALRSLLENSAFQFIKNSQANVKSHYDLPQEVFDVYLDSKYMSYSSGMFDQRDIEVHRVYCVAV